MRLMQGTQRTYGAGKLALASWQLNHHDYVDISHYRSATGRQDRRLQDSRNWKPRECSDREHPDVKFGEDATG